MTKEQITKAFEQVPLPIDSCWLVMGAALVMHGIRNDTHDIDIGCTPEAFDMLIDLGYHVTLSRSGRRKLSLNSEITVYEGFCTQSVHYIDGVPVADLASIRKTKATFGRQKDLADIEQIDQYFARMNQND